MGFRLKAEIAELHLDIPKHKLVAGLAREVAKRNRKSLKAGTDINDKALPKPTRGGKPLVDTGQLARSLKAYRVKGSKGLTYKIAFVGYRVARDKIGLKQARAARRSIKGTVKKFKATGKPFQLLANDFVKDRGYRFSLVGIPRAEEANIMETLKPIADKARLRALKRKSVRYGKL